MTDAKITDIFSSIQGEGIYVGQPQIFVRFAGCNLNCDFCDTVKKGGRRYSAFGVLDFINTLNAANTVDTISITGGEPLLHADFLRLFLPQLKKRNFRIYLETNGTLPSALDKILNSIDIISMDIKLPSGQNGKRSFWTRHRDFLKLARKKTVFVKAVVTDRATEEEIKKAVTLIDDVDFRIPFVIQPVTPANRIKKKVPADKLFAFQRLAKAVLDDVRIIPQVHKIMKVK